MNFADFSFWWSLTLLSCAFLLIRRIGQTLKLWSPICDQLSLLVISLSIFWNAAKVSFLIFAFEVIFNYVMVCLIQDSQGWRAKVLAILTISVDLSILFYFKYLTFLFQDILGITIVSLSSTQPEQTSIIQKIPPGISFYTFEMISFVVDSLRVKGDRKVRFIDFINFISFFPKLVAGPIERRLNLLPQLQSFRFKFSSQNAEIGFRWIAFGLFMKLVLSGNIASLSNPQELTNAWSIWLSTYLFGLRVYFDFAGYSFIALGLARVIGIELTPNFLAPYVADSVQDFWRRWHITLSNWLRDYLYLPLGGSKVPWVALNIIVVFTISGLWHGASWNFVIWGFYHGILLVIHRYIGKYFTMPKFLAWLLTFQSVMMSWLFFMETNLSHLLLKLQTIITPTAYSFSNAKAIVPTGERELLAIIILLCSMVLIGEHLAHWQKRQCVYEFFLTPLAARILFALVILFTAGGSSEFIYFAF